QSLVKGADGRMYMAPEGLKTVPDSVFQDHIKATGAALNDAAVANLREDIASTMSTIAIDRARHAVLEPSARTRSMLLQGTVAGTFPGEVMRAIAQFKSFGVEMLKTVYGREIYGRGYDTLGDWWKNSSGGEKANVAAIFAMH